MRRIFSLRLLAVVFTAFLFDCATLDKLPADTCGNKVIDDATEDCDGEKVKDRACGAPGTGVLSCRLLCTVSTDCPAGWGCAHEGYCRAPTGSFVKVTDAVSSEVTSMSVGDFDGDHRVDILASGPRGGDNAVRTKILYFGPGGALEHTNALSAPIVSPEARDFDGDGIDDFSFGATGFAIIRGQSDRSLVPVTFPSFRAPHLDGKPVFIHGTKRVLPSDANDAGDPLSSSSFLVAGTSAQGPSLVSLEPDSRAAGPQFLVIPLPAGLDQIVGTPIAGKFLDADALSTCEDVVIALNTGPTSGEIDVISPCRGNKWADASDVVRIKVGEALVGGVMLSDIDVDGHLDLLYGTAAGVYVVKGTGTKIFLAAQHVDSTDFREVPLAARDIGFDGHPDFVTPGGIVLSVPSSGSGGDGGTDAGPTTVPSHLGTFKILGLEYFALPSARRTRWTVAAIEDLNKDGYLDVVAGSAEVPDSDFIQTGEGGVASSTIPTNGPVRFLQIGDYDGDGVFDLAFVESRIATNDFAVMYAYGRPSRPPEAPQIVGRLTDIVGVHVLSEQTFPNSVDIFSREPPTPPETISTLAISALLGSGDRQSLSPLLLVPAKGADALTGLDVARNWQPMAVHAGKFLEKGQIDMFALATGYTITAGGTLDIPNSPSAVWLAKATGPLTFESAAMVAPISKFGLIDPATQVFQAPTVTGDIDSPPDGLLESLSLARIDKDVRPSIAIVRPGKIFDVTAVALPDKTSITARSSIATLDADNDGLTDIVVVVTAGGLGTPATAPTRAFLFLNTSGAFDATKGIEIVAPAAPDQGADSGPAAVAMVTTGAASASGDGTLTRRLAIVTQHRVLLASVKGDRSGLDYAELTPLLGKRGLVSGTGITSGDFDGDGIEDLAVADGGSVRLLLQGGRLP